MLYRGLAVSFGFGMGLAVQAVVAVAVVVDVVVVAAVIEFADARDGHVCIPFVLVWKWMVLIVIAVVGEVDIFVGFAGLMYEKVEVEEARIDLKLPPLWASLRVVVNALDVRLLSDRLPILFRWRSFLPFYLVLHLCLETFLVGGLCILVCDGGKTRVFLLLGLSRDLLDQLSGVEYSLWVDLYRILATMIRELLNRMLVCSDQSI